MDIQTTQDIQTSGPLVPTCEICNADIDPPARAQLKYTTCLSCGETQARKVKHLIAPLNKSNYYHFYDPELLKQLNPKRT